jgi:AGZA family xanthine/uracil permease-like MFS transporter
MRFNWFYAGDIDGFFGLFVDNLLQLLLIQVLCTAVCGLPADLVSGRILPAAALSILVGNLFYAWQAKRLAERTGRPYTTALPYGINTVSLFAHIFLIMGPVFRATGSGDLAWKAGLFACLGSAIIEILGAFVGHWLRAHTPRAALLTALAGIALTFISMGFVFQIFSSPLLAIIPAFLILFVYSARVKLPWGLPGGFVAVAVGTALAWGLRALGHPVFTPDTTPVQLGLHLPQSAVGDMLSFLSQGGWQYLSVILPMGLFNVVGSLQNLESAEAAGDRYETMPSLLANGLGGLAAAAFGSPFPTTIYIGHPGWKAMGARWGYSILNGVVISALCLMGGVGLILKVVPLEAMIGILLWIGIIIAAQAYRDVPRGHFLGVAFGFVPTLAAWVLLNIETTLRVAGTSLFDAAAKFSPNDIALKGVFALNQGFILSAMLFASLLVYATERQWMRVAAWALGGAILAWFGIIHAYELTPLGLQVKLGWGAAPGFAAAYFGVALLALGLQRLSPAGVEPQGGRRFFDKRAGRFEREQREGGPVDGKPQGRGGGRRRRWRGRKANGDNGSGASARA